MEIDLSGLNDAYQEVARSRFSDGCYPARIVKAEVSLSKADRPVVVWDLEVQDPANGRTITVKKYSALQPNALYYLHGDLTKLGVPLDDINDLHQALKDLEGATIEIDLKNDDEGWYKPNFIRLVAKPF